LTDQPSDAESLNLERDLQQQKKVTKKVLKLLEAGGMEALKKLSPKFRGLGLFEALLERSWALRHDDPGQMIQLAMLATQITRELDARKYGAEKLMDFQCRAWAALGNAHRVADQLESAQLALGYADELYHQGTGDKELGISVLDLQASLAGDCRRFGLACQTLTSIYHHHLKTGNSHLAGKALIGKGLYMGYWGKPEEALEILREGLTLIDVNLDAELTFAAVHNQVTFLVNCGRYREAKKVLFLNRRYMTEGLGRVNVLRVRWEEGRIDAGLGALVSAEQAFREVKQKAEEVKRPFDSALVSLDLAAVLMKLNRRQEAQELVIEAARVFTGLRIEREAWMAVLMLKRTFETEQASAVLVEEVAAFVRRSQNDPAARFNPSPE